MIGKTISHYKILEVLGEGGMGKVYKAQDTALNRTVALKFFPKHLLSSDEDKKRFFREAQAISALDHPNIMTIYDIYEDDNNIFLAMACIEGELFNQRIERKPFKPIEIINLAIQIGNGLHATHSANIIHRDIKAENIIVGDDGKVTILDFGLAKQPGTQKITKEGSTLGTLTNMSPEQVQGLEIDHRTDLWSMGVVLYQMATNQMPFTETHDAAVMYSILNEEPAPVTISNPKIPGELGRIIHKLLNKAPDERYQHADDLVADLKNLKKASESKLSAPTKSYTGPMIQHKKRSNWKKRAIITSVVVIAIIIGFFSYKMFWLNGKFDQMAFVSSADDHEKSIAVLPFTAIGDDEENIEFSFGIHDDILASLASIKKLRVASRTSVMPYQKTTKSLSEIGATLNVNTILEGSVRKAGNRIRIVAQLINVETNDHIWAETYDRELNDIFQVQSDIARNIAFALQIALTDKEQGQIDKIPTQNMEAYENYIKGKYLYLECKTDEEFFKSKEFFRKAATLDSSYSNAWLMMMDVDMTYYDPNKPNASKWRVDSAYIYIENAKNFGNVSENRIERIEKYIDYTVNGNLKEWLEYRLKHQNTSSAIDQLNVGRLITYSGNPKEAQKYYKRSVELGPEILYALRDYFYNSLRIEDYDLAQKLAIKLFHLLPDYEQVHMGWFYLVLFQSGDMAIVTEKMDSLLVGMKAGSAYKVRQSIAEFDRQFIFALNYIELSGEKNFLDRALYHKQLNHFEISNNYLDSARIYQEDEIIKEPMNAYAHGKLGIVYAYLGLKEKALVEGQKAMDIWPIEKDLGYGEDQLFSMAHIQTVLGNNQEAIDIIEILLSYDTVYKKPLFDLYFIFDPLRDDLRFKKLMN